MKEALCVFFLFSSLNFKRDDGVQIEDGEMIDRLTFVGCFLSRRNRVNKLRCYFSVQKINELIERMTTSRHPIACRQSFGKRERERKKRKKTARKDQNGLNFFLPRLSMFILRKTDLKNFLSFDLPFLISSDSNIVLSTR